MDFNDNVKPDTTQDQIMAVDDVANSTSVSEKAVEEKSPIKIFNGRDSESSTSEITRDLLDESLNCSEEENDNKLVIDESLLNDNLEEKNSNYVTEENQESKINTFAELPILKPIEKETSLEDTLMELNEEETPLPQLTQIPIRKTTESFNYSDNGNELWYDFDSIRSLSPAKFNDLEESRDSLLVIDEKVSDKSMRLPILMPIEKEKGADSTTSADVENRSLPQLTRIQPRSNSKDGDVERESAGSSSGNIPEKLECDEEVLDDTSLLSISKASSESNEGKKKSFVDSLLSKFRKNSDCSKSELEKFLSESEDDLLVEIDTPLLFSKPTNPNIMSTPIVRNQRTTSAFVNNVEEYNQTVARHKVSNVSQAIDKSQMGDKSKLPGMRAPDVPTNLRRPRTVAEKRQLFNTYNLKSLMREQESNIFKQLTRKKDRQEINYPILDAMVTEDLPISQGTWKVLTFLRTRANAFIHSYQIINGEIIKFNGSRGNHRNKYLPPQDIPAVDKYKISNLRSSRCCPGGRVQKRTLESIVNSESIKRFVLHSAQDSPQMQLDTKFLNNQLVSVKPRPLSKKLELLNEKRKSFQNDEDGVFLGDYSNFNMPKVKLELNVKPKTALDVFAKKYLKEILPHRDLTENWCEFALSALESKDKKKATDKDTFEFTIPYESNKRCLLVREILKSKEDNEQLRIPPYKDDDEEEDDMEWTFAKDLDKNDPIECDVADVIKDLTNSVFINLNDDLFTQDDPHDLVTNSSPLKTNEALSVLSTLSKDQSSSAKRTLMELKRLNANVFKSDSACVEDENDMRRHATAHLGKIERELRPTVIITDSDTILLGNKQKESRRLKRAPKKFDDYLKPSTKLADHDEHNNSEDDDPPTKKYKTKAGAAESSYKPKQRECNFSIEDARTVREEVKRMLHVNVQLTRLRNVSFLEHWCMVHQLYKCSCRGWLVTGEPLNLSSSSNTHRSEPPRRLSIAPSTFKRPRQESIQSSTLTKEPATVEGAQPTPGISNQAKAKTFVVFHSDGSPKLELVNIGDLINGGKGPIFINIYNCAEMKMNSVLRSVLNFQSAIVSMDNTAYFIDKKKIDASKLDFTEIIGTLKNPIFILQAKDECLEEKSGPEKIFFSKSVKSIIQIVEDSALISIQAVIDSILNKVRRIISQKVGENPNENVKQQLLKISRVRELTDSPTMPTISCSDSVSSNNSSPLSFHGLRLTEAPPPGVDTPMMKAFNGLFTKRMNKLVEFVKSNTMRLCPSREMFNKFYVYKWSLLLKSFEEDLIQIWQATLEGDEGNKYNVLAVTESRFKPDIEHASRNNVVNIRKLSLSDKLTELTRLILLKIEKASMQNMTLLLYGCKGYFRILGILNAKEPYDKVFVAKPSHYTHPRLSKKIEKIYKIWYSKMSLQKPEEQSEEELRKLGLEKIKKQEVEKMKKLELDQIRKQQLATASSAMMSKATNIKRPLGSSSTQVKSSNFKWLLFSVTDDFSCMYVKQWARYISYAIIMDAIKKAKKKQRAVALIPQVDNLKKWPKMLALHAAPLNFNEQEEMSGNFLIFGPFVRSATSQVQLMMNFEGELLLRDEFEKEHNVVRDQRTKCLWIYANNLKCVNNVEPEPIYLDFSKYGFGFQKSLQPREAKTTVDDTASNALPDSTIEDEPMDVQE